MIEISNNFRSRYRSAVRKARAERIRCVKLEEGLFYVARRAENHGRYLVFIRETKSGVFATCRNLEGYPCPTTKGTDRCCAHIATAVERGIQDGRKRQRAAA